MKIKEIIGIDVSKKTIDVMVHTTQKHREFGNNSAKDIKIMAKWALKNTSFSQENILFVFEHTGLYSHQLATTLTELGMSYTAVSGLEIKRSLGLVRGKDDKSDATNIALYGYRLRDELEPSQIPTEALQSIKRLLRLRKRLVRQRAGFKASLKEHKRVLKVKDNQVFFEVQEKVLKELSKQIVKIEKAMDTIIKENKELTKMYKLITSIKGVGAQTALYMIVYTQGFTQFETWRKFASYCGTAPFPNSSGTSLKGRTKVSHLANKEIKALLSCCATSALQYSPEMKQYYNRRLDQGKNKMSTINIIRNKLLARIFAVVERGTPYVNTLKYAA